MDGQHRYEMNLKKNDLFINLSSDDVTFISRQMDQWCRILLNGHYSPPVRQAPPPPLPIAQPVPPVIVEAPSSPPAASAAAPPVIPVPAPEMTPAMTSPPPVPTPPSVPQALPEPVMVAAAPPPPLPISDAPAPVAIAPVPTASSPLPTPAPVAVASPPLPTPAPTSPPPPAADPIATASPPVPQDDFEAVMDSVMRDLAQSAPEPASSPALPLVSTSAVPASTTLPFSTAAPTPETPVPLGDLYERAGTANVFDSLLLAALHLTHSEHQETFSLKRLNSALVKAGLTPVNHSVLEAALSAGVLAMVPDLTGTADVSEYRLTSEGLQSANALL